MNSGRSWRQEYDSMKQFIAEHPEIVITPTEISVPQPVKDEFYARFDRIRGAIVDERYASLPVDMETLCRSYLDIEKEVIALLGIERIAMPVDLASFLHNPQEGLARILYNRLFDLLQGKEELDSFEIQSATALDAIATDLYRLGYEWWAALTMIRLLDPDQAFRVDLDEDYKPFLTELKEISFGRQAHHPTIRIPEFALRLRTSGRYVAVKMAIAKELESYVVPFKPAVKPKKRTGDTSLVLDSRAMLLSFMSGPNDIPVIADIYERTLTSPDWIIEYVTESEYQDGGAIAQVRRHVDGLNPKMGAFVIVVGVIGVGSEKPEETMSEGVCAVAPGFDITRLQRVVDRLVSV